MVQWGAMEYEYRPGVSNLLVLLIGGVPIAMPTVLSVVLAMGEGGEGNDFALYRAYTQYPGTLYILNPQFQTRNLLILKSKP